MRRRWQLFLLMGLAGVALLRTARAYTPELVNYVVCSAFLQKLPPGISPEEARGVFSDALAAGTSDPRKTQKHLDQLFAVSQRLEKIQRLSTGEAIDLLSRIRTSASSPVQ